MLDYDYDALREIGRIVALARDEMAKAVKPGMTTKQLDEIGQRILEAEGPLRPRSRCMSSRATRASPSMTSLPTGFRASLSSKTGMWSTSTSRP